METRSQELIRQMKETRNRKNISNCDIMEALKVNGYPVVSLTTVRRVFANCSENRASNFNYEQTLLPIANAIKKIDNSFDDSPKAKEIEKLKEIIGVQYEELDRIMESKEHLDTSISYLREQIAEKDTLIKRLIDRLDQKDEIINQLLLDLKK